MGVLLGDVWNIAAVATTPAGHGSERLKTQQILAIELHSQSRHCKDSNCAVFRVCSCIVDFPSAPFPTELVWAKSSQTVENHNGYSHCPLQVHSIMCYKIMWFECRIVQLCSTRYSQQSRNLQSRLISSFVMACHWSADMHCFIIITWALCLKISGGDPFFLQGLFYRQGL